MTKPQALCQVDGLEFLASTCDPMIYFLCQGDAVIYVGQTINIFTRINTHRGDKAFDSVYFLRCQLDELDAAESHWIRALAPQLNRTHFPHKVERNRAKAKAYKVAKDSLVRERGVKAPIMRSEILDRMDAAFASLYQSECDKHSNKV